MDLDTLIVYDDGKELKLRAQYPIKTITSFAPFIGEEPFGDILEIKSENPAFLLRFQMDSPTMMTWVEELDWRVQAYYRIFKYNEGSSDASVDAVASVTSDVSVGSSSTVDSGASSSRVDHVASISACVDHDHVDSVGSTSVPYSSASHVDASVSGPSSSGTGSLNSSLATQVGHIRPGASMPLSREFQVANGISKRTKSKLEKKKKHKSSEPSVEEIFQDYSTVMNISESQKELMQRSWLLLLEKKFTHRNDEPISGFTKLFEDFYERLFAVNPTARRLFEHTGMEVQGRALANIISVILNSSTNMESLQQELIILGGIHMIYGIQATDYQTFANCLCDTLAQLLGDQDFDATTRDTWFRVTMNLAAIFLDAGSEIEKAGKHSCVP
eukprot:TRINITY_DN15742_c0_g1_i1.p1 TRINITY_DN15742_c0_g1~~TRINITY_DN15742_c0_g1_i1.p1  ORF type:complete len:423 (-),score=67.71 TRINITY_DN15742_c0_g1_i1:165-1325(-)